MPSDHLRLNSIANSPSNTTGTVEKLEAYAKEVIDKTLNDTEIALKDGHGLELKEFKGLNEPTQTDCFHDYSINSLIA